MTCCCLFSKLIYLIGTIVLLKAIFKLLKLVYKFKFRKPYNLIERYGQNTWAVV